MSWLRPSGTVSKWAFTTVTILQEEEPASALLGVQGVEEDTVPSALRGVHGVEVVRMDTWWRTMSKKITWRMGLLRMVRMMRVAVVPGWSSAAPPAGPWGAAGCAAASAGCLCRGTSRWWSRAPRSPPSLPGPTSPPLLPHPPPWSHSLWNAH